MGALIDTGARAANYVNLETLDWLVANGAEVVDTASKRVCTAFNNCRVINQEIEISIAFKNFITGHEKNSFKVISLDTHFDLIIGLQTIGLHALTLTMLGIGAVSRNSSLNRSSKVGQAVSGTGHSKTSLSDCTLCSLEAERMSKDMFFDPEPVAEEIDEPPSIQIEDIRAPSLDDETNNQVPLENIQGPESLQKCLRTLVGKHKELFSKTVRPDPAKVTPMRLTVNHEDFKCPANKTAPRPQSTAKLAALKDFITELLRLGVIKVSREATVSQVLLVQKPGGNSLRFCVDYREFN